MLTSELLERYNTNEARCCRCGCKLTSADGLPLGAVFVLDKNGKFYCTNCDDIFDDIDDRIFEPDLDEGDIVGLDCEVPTVIIPNIVGEE